VKKCYYHANNLYNVAAITDKNGVVVERYNYSPYGEATILDAAGTTVLGASTIANPWTFTGRRLDAETGLMYYRARYYDAALGRFVGRDPLGYVDGLSVYIYVRSSPSNIIDPLGTDGNPVSGPNGPVGPSSPYDPWPWHPQPVKPPKIAPPPAPITNEIGVGLGAGGGFAIGAGPDLSPEISITAVVTTECRTCVTVTAAVTIGVSTPGLYGTVGVVGSFGANGLHGPSIGVGGGGTVAVGPGIDASIEGTYGSESSFPIPDGIGVYLGVGAGAGGVAGVRVSFNCTGCATLWLGPLSPVVASYRAGVCAQEAIRNRLGI
jgi:RHS repeat-associated protein